MTQHSELPILPFQNQAAFAVWMQANHASTAGLWIQMAKKSSGLASITHDEALDVALCYGWIDSLRRGQDETYFLQKFTPRRTGSAWSARNIATVHELIKAGRMQPSGFTEIERAKREGRWV
ncbi:MAG TPA: hypothetical protein VLG92_04705 [Candidatus Saccharimonadia bacterium]|nr:hypothetical protein [Candidatus Saccharimonadia bacterium]